MPTKATNEETRAADQLDKGAADRASLSRYSVKLALDRTTLAWIRTTLTMASFGFGMVAFFRTLQAAHPTSAETIKLHDGAVKMGMSLLVLGILATVFAGVSHWRTLSRLRQGGVPVITHWPLSITVAALLAGIGLPGFYHLLMR